MFSIRVTAPDGTTRTFPFPGTQVSIGRDASNSISIDGPGVSKLHCMIELTGTSCTLKDRGSTNGTWLNDRRLDEPTPVTDRDRIYVGSYLIQLTMLAPEPERGPIATADLPAVSGPILRGAGPERAWRDQSAKLQRFAEQWAEAGRPDRLALRAGELQRAQRWLASRPPTPADEATALQREFVTASERAVRRGTVKTVLLAVGGVVVLGGATTAAFLLWPRPEPETVPDEAVAGSDDSGGEIAQTVEIESTRPTTVREGGDDQDAVIKQEIDHVVIPTETIADIAKRYGVTVEQVAEWNLINPDEPVREGQIVVIKSPVKRPLGQQQFEYEVEKGETWSKLAERFGVTVTRLRAFNPTIEELAPATKIVVWVDPKPYKPREPQRPIPEFHVDPRSVSTGAPNAGKLIDGIQMPESDAYTRRNPNIMYASAYTIANLQKALAMFRQDVDFDGVIIVADMSKRGGGHFDPHKSHQSGRDVDIWLPTLRGVYKRKFLNRDYLGGPKTTERKPYQSEIDWYAVWGLVRALGKTGAVQEVFLDWILHENVYNAAKNMGATDEELAASIQWPRKKVNPVGLLRHSDRHYSHIHVRFKCAPWEKNCDTRTALHSE